MPRHRNKRKPPEHVRDASKPSESTSSADVISRIRLQTYNNKYLQFVNPIMLGLTTFYITLGIVALTWPDDAFASYDEAVSFRLQAFAETPAVKYFIGKPISYTLLLAFTSAIDYAVKKLSLTLVNKYLIPDPLNPNLSQQQAERSLAVYKPLLGNESNIKKQEITKKPIIFHMISNASTLIAYKYLAKKLIPLIINRGTSYIIRTFNYLTDKWWYYNENFKRRENNETILNTLTGILRLKGTEWITITDISTYLNTLPNLAYPFHDVVGFPQQLKCYALCLSDAYFPATYYSLLISWALEKLDPEKENFIVANEYQVGIIVQQAMTFDSVLFVKIKKDLSDRLKNSGDKRKYEIAKIICQYLNEKLNERLAEILPLLRDNQSLPKWKIYIDIIDKKRGPELFVQLRHAEKLTKEAKDKILENNPNFLSSLTIRIDNKNIPTTINELNQGLFPAPATTESVVQPIVYDEPEIKLKKVKVRVGKIFIETRRWWLHGKTISKPTTIILPSGKSYAISAKPRSFSLLHNTHNNTYYCAFLQVPIETELASPLQIKLIKSLLSEEITKLKSPKATGNCIKWVNHLPNPYHFEIHPVIKQSGDIRIYGQKINEEATLVFSDGRSQDIGIILFDKLDDKPHSACRCETFIHR